MTEPDRSDHLLVRTSDTTHETTLECLDGCGRRLVVRHEPPELLVLGRGDPAAVHHWADLGVGFAASVRS